MFGVGLLQGVISEGVLSGGGYVLGSFSREIIHSTNPIDGSTVPNANHRSVRGQHYIYTLYTKIQVKLCSVVFTKQKLYNINNTTTLNISKTGLNKIELDN